MDDYYSDYSRVARNFLNDGDLSDGGSGVPGELNRKDFLEMLGEFYEEKDRKLKASMDDVADCERNVAEKKDEIADYKERLQDSEEELGKLKKELKKEKKKFEYYKNGGRYEAFIKKMGSGFQKYLDSRGLGGGST